MQWYRAYVGTCSDPKFTIIARRTGKPRAAIIAIWHALLERACEVDNAGALGDDLDLEVIAATVDETAETVSGVSAAFRQIGMIRDGAIVAWSKRQYQSDSSTARVRKFRQKQRSETPETAETQNVTAETVSETHETHQSRAEQSRAEQSTADQNARGRANGLADKPRRGAHLLNGGKPPPELHPDAWHVTCSFGRLLALHYGGIDLPMTAEGDQQGLAELSATQREAMMHDANRWLLAGATYSTMRETIHQGMRRMQERGKPRPGSLHCFRLSLAEATGIQP